MQEHHFYEDRKRLCPLSSTLFYQIQLSAFASWAHAIRIQRDSPFERLDPHISIRPQGIQSISSTPLSNLVTSKMRAMVHQLAKPTFCKRNSLSIHRMSKGKFLDRLKDKVAWCAIWNSLSKLQISKGKRLERLKSKVSWCVIWNSLSKRKMSKGKWFERLRNKAVWCVIWNNLSKRKISKGKRLERLKDMVAWRAILNSSSKHRMSKGKRFDRLKDKVAWCAISRESSAKVCPRRRCPGNASVDFICFLLLQQIFRSVISSILRF